MKTPYATPSCPHDGQKLCFHGWTHRGADVFDLYLCHRCGRTFSFDLAVKLLAETA